jgi:hypothetical protein
MNTLRGTVGKAVASRLPGGPRNTVAVISGGGLFRFAPGTGLGVSTRFRMTAPGL